MSLPAQNVAPQIAAAPAQTIFPFAWRCDDATTVKVYVNDTLTVAVVALNADQTAAPGGTVTIAATAGGEIVTVERVSPLTQTTALTKYGAFQADTITKTLDRVVMLSQEAAAILGKCIRATRSKLTKYTSLDLPAPVDKQVLAIVTDPNDATKFILSGIDRATFIANFYGDGLPVIGPQAWTFLGDAIGTTGFAIPGAVVADPAVYLVTIDGTLQAPVTDYTINIGTQQIVFATTPAENAKGLVRCFGYARAAAAADAYTVNGTAAAPVLKTLAAWMSWLLKMLSPHVVVYSAAMAIDANAGGPILITPTDGAAHTINNPTNGFAGQRLGFRVKNTFGVLGALTWGAAFRVTGWVQPANGFNRYIEFQFDGALWQQTGPISPDIAN